VISKQTNVSFFIIKSRTPTIVSPQNDYHWSNGKNISFVWKYNGEDVQYLYQIQVIKLKINSREEIETVLESFNLDNSNYDYYEYSGSGNSQQITLDLSSEITEDGIFVWRIRTQGTLAREWSDWAENGLVRVDSKVPVIRNISALTKSPLGKLSTSLNDLSSPYIYTERLYDSVSVKDRHIDRDGQPGLYIYYDYRDNSINIKAQSGSESSKRYYGLISFHKNATSLTEILGSGSSRVYDSKYSIQNLVRSVYQYSVNKEESSLGPFDDVSADQIVNGKKIFPTLNLILNSADYDDGDSQTVNFVPQGLPTFISNSVYNNQGFSNHPIGFESTENFISTFPAYSRRFKKRTYKFPDETESVTFNSIVGEEYVEVRYPSPYQDFFLIFKKTGTNSNVVDLVAYGQYKDEDEVKKIMVNPSGSITDYTFLPRRGFSVIQNRNNQKKPNDSNNLLFDPSNTTLYTRSNLGVVNHENYSGTLTEDMVYYISPFSYQMFFNLNPTFSKDQALKIYLKEETLQLVEYQKNLKNEGVDPVIQVSYPYVEFNFRPDSDCTSVFTTENNLGSDISLDEVFIGRARVSPRDLFMYEDSPSQKTIYEDIKIHYEDKVKTVTGWGNTELNFNSDITKYNGSVRLHISEFEYIPYYSYGTAYNNLTKNPIPNIYNADPNPNPDNTINWDSIEIKSARVDDSEKDLVILEDLIYTNDFLRFNNTSKFLGQINPYLYNMFKWNSRPENGNIFGKGKILKHRTFANNGVTKTDLNYLNCGYTMYEDGWSSELTYPVSYNQTDRGFFAVADIEDGDVGKKIFLKDFSNHIFQRSIAIDIEDSFSELQQVLDKIYPSTHLSHDRTFVWEGNDIQTENVEITGENGPSWIFNLQEGDDKAEFIQSLISEDYSTQGLFKNISWARTSTIGVSGLYLTVLSSELINEQIDRSVFGYDSLQKESLFLRSEIQNNSLPSGVESYISGDTFELGNIFGFIYPDSDNVVKFSFDVDESTSGIDSIKFLEVDIPVELASGDLESQVSSEHFFGIKTDGVPSKVPIKIQKLNEYAYNYDLNFSSISEDIFSEIRTSRSPIDAVEYYMDNSPDIEYVSMNNSDVLDIETSRTDYGFKRFTHSISVSGGGFKILFFKVKDKAGNESEVYSVPFYIQGSQTISPANVIESATIVADDRLLISKELKTVLSNSYEFWTNLLPTDTKNNRTIVVKDVLVGDNLGGLINHPYVNDLLIGFSDNYGLSYNVYSPYSSIVGWNFKRPISIKVKGFSSGYKGPDWFFDPNDVRHYIPDTAEDYSQGVGENNNIVNVQNFHIPVNPGSTPRTLIGFLDENTENYARSNPVAKEIYNNREEFIGKSLIIGSAQDFSFKILDVFRSNNLSPSIRFDSNGLQTDDYSADSDGGTTISSVLRQKIWILIEDEEGIAATILSRKFQYITEDIEEINFITKSGTGWRDSLKDSFDTENRTVKFGYYPVEDEIPSSVNSIINDSLKITKNITADVDSLVSGDNQTPTAIVGTSDEYIYIDPAEFDDTSSGISSNEGWTTRIYQGYSHIGFISTPQTILDQVQHHQLLGINFYNKLVFGQNYTVSAKIFKVFYDSSLDESYVVLHESGIDYTMRNLSYSIVDSLGNNISLGSIDNEIKNISIDGDLLVVSGDISTILNVDSEYLPDDSYVFNVVVDGLDGIDDSTGLEFDRGWWPKIDGLPIPPIDQKIGSSMSLWNEFNIKFALVSTGSFYIPKDGTYIFKIEKDLYSYSDFSIDFFGKDVERYVEEDGEYVKKITSIYFNSTSGETEKEKEVYLIRGWHTARLRNLTENTFSEESYKNYLRLLYSKPGWEDSDGNYFFVPLVGSNNEDMNFMSRAYRSVFGRIIDKDYSRFPKQDWEVDPEENYIIEEKLLKAVVGFKESPTAEEITSYYNYQAIKIDRDSGDDSRPTISSTIPAETRPTYAGEILEEAQATYISNVFDGGSDFRFWKEISWTSSKPTGTTVEFEVRTGSSEEDLLLKTWNNIGTETVTEILDPFTISGQELVDFSQLSVDNNNNLILKRFIQFKIILKSSIKDVTPTVDDVTITYSKQNSVNFFTTTFNLTSNIVRSILTYNGDIPTSPSGVALSDIQFGISTEEDVNGKVITNFDEYTIIPTNEVFSLSSIGVQSNNKFRIGIRFISTDGSIPSVDEMAILFETDGERDQVKDLIDRVDNG